MKGSRYRALAHVPCVSWGTDRHAQTSHAGSMLNTLKKSLAMLAIVAAVVVGTGAAAGADTVSHTAVYSRPGAITTQVGKCLINVPSIGLASNQTADTQVFL